MPVAVRELFGLYARARRLTTAATEGAPVIAAAGLCVKAEDTGRVLLHQRPLDDDNAPGKLEFPGGHLEPGEDPFEGACREFEEETGLPVPEGGSLAAAEVAEEGGFILFTLVVPEEFPLGDRPEEEAGVGNSIWHLPEEIEGSDALREEAKSNDWTAIKEAKMKPDETAPTGAEPVATEPAAGALVAATPPAEPGSRSVPGTPDPGATPATPAGEPARAPTSGSDVIVCLLPDPDVVSQLAVDGGEPAERLHLTLATLGSSSSLDRATVEAAVAKALAPETPEPGEPEGDEPVKEIAGTFDGLARFPAGDSGVPIVATFSAPDLADFQGDLLEALGASLDLPDQADGFIPHVTLRYVSGDSRAEIPLGPPPGVKATFSDVVLAFGDVATDANLTYFAIDGSDSTPLAEPSTEPARPAPTAGALGATGGSVTDKAWDGSAGRFTDEQYQRAAAACDPASKGTVKARCVLPHHEPGGAINRNGVHAAAQRVGSLSGRSPEALATAKSHLRSHYTRDLKEEPPDSLGKPGAGRAGARRGALQVPAAKPPEVAPAPGAKVPPSSTSVGPVGFDPANCLLARGTFSNDESGAAFASALKDGAPLWPSADYSDATYLLSEDPDGTLTESYSSALAIGVVCLPLQAQSYLRIVVLEDEAPDATVEPAPEGAPPDDVEAQIEEALEDLLGGGGEQAGPPRFLMLWHVEGMPTDEGGTSQARRNFDPGSYRFRENGVGLPVHWRNFIAPGHDGAILGGWTSEMWRGASVEDLATLGLNPDGTPVVDAESAEPAETDLGPTDEAPMAMAAALCACAETPVAPVRPPAAWFEPPDLDGPTAIQVTPEGRVFGHLAGPDCFLSATPGRCLKVRTHTSRDFSRFNHGGDDRNGGILTAEGTQVRTGCITLAGGHPNLGLSAAAAKKAYDDTDSVAAFVRAGWDAKNDLPYVAGALRSDLGEAKAQVIRALGLSGDWRTHEDWRPVDGKPELIALPVVPTPAWGFRGVTRIAAAASGGLGTWDGELVDNVLGIGAIAASAGALEVVGADAGPSALDEVLAIAAAALDARVYGSPTLDDLAVYGRRLEDADAAILGR